MKPEELYKGLQVVVAGNRGTIKWDSHGMMEEDFLGSIVTIDSIDYVKLFQRWQVRIAEDCTWMWNPEDFDPIVDIDPISEAELDMILFGGDIAQLMEILNQE